IRAMALRIRQGGDQFLQTLAAPRQQAEHGSLLRITVRQRHAEAAGCAGDEDTLHAHECSKRQVRTLARCGLVIMLPKLATATLLFLACRRFGDEEIQHLRRGSEQYLLRTIAQAGADNRWRRQVAAV